MSYQELREFLISKMRMSHIYQPVMIKKLLKNNGKANDKEIAEMLLQYDPSQLEYYQNITNNMVGKVLRSHEIVSKLNSSYSLSNFEEFTLPEKVDLIAICDQKLASYIEKRGDAIWSHRRINRNSIPGSIRYEVLKRAQFRCELCGISADERALEVDHIEPVNTGGKDEIANYQALCYVCNASKGDRDNTDFRDQGEKYKHRDKNCLFCHIGAKRIVGENKLAYLVKDKYPVPIGHSLIIPKRHFSDYFEITQAELNGIRSLMHIAKEELIAQDESILGFTIGVNNGAVAGQTILHSHMHLIPRRRYDVPEPIGGIRNVIPGMGSYGN